MKNTAWYCIVITAVLLAPNAHGVPVTDGLIIHLDAETISGLNDGDGVTTWADSATADAVDGTVRQITLYDPQYGATVQYGVPVFKTNVVNGRPAVRFARPADPDQAPPSAKQILVSDDWSWDQTRGLTVFIVGTGGITSNVQRAVQVGKEGGQAYKHLAADLNASDSGARYGNGYCLASSPFDYGDWHISVRQMEQGGSYGSVRYWVNDATFLLPTITNQPDKNIDFDPSGNVISIGNGYHADAGHAWAWLDWYDGDLAEVLVYNRQLSCGQIEQVFTYLNEKYDTVAPLQDGLVIHLKADSLSLADNDPVAAWADSATDDAVDGTVSQIALYDPQYGATVQYGVPAFQTDAINGHPAVRFTRPSGDPDLAPPSAKQILVSNDWSWDPSQGVTMFIVATGGITGGSGYVQRAVQVGKEGGENFKNFAADLNSTDSGIRYGNGYCLASSPFQHGDWHLSVRQIAQGGGYGSIRYSVNDTPFLLTNTNQPSRNIDFDASGNVISVGNGYNADANHAWAWLDWYDGSLAEVLVYNRQLTPAQIGQVSRYLNEEYHLYTPTPAKPFTIAAIPDTQGYVTPIQPEGQEIFREEMQFIVDNVDNMNIVFASHEGDVVMNGADYSAQWGRAVYAMDALKNTIPFGMVPGNHDYDTTFSQTPLVGSTDWNANFGHTTDYFRDKAWYGGYAVNGSDSDGMTTYQTFSTDDIDFLHIALELDASDARLNWAQGIVNAHPGWPTIVTTHSYMNASNGALRTSYNRPTPRNSGQEIWDEFIKVNPQIFMVLCGHSFDGDYNCSQRRDDQNIAGYPVHQLLADYQGCWSGSSDIGTGGGWVRLMHFSPATNTVRVRTYSTILNKYSSDPSLTDGSTYARNWAAFNYDDQGDGSLYSESHSKASEFTIPFIYGRQLPRPTQAYGQYIAGLTKSIALDSAVEWLPGGLAFDPTRKVNGSYDRVYFVNRVSDGNQGLYAASISQETTSSQLALTTLDNPYGCTVDADGNAYVCYNATPAVWKVANPTTTAVETQMIGNYRNTGDDDIQSIMMAPNGFGPGVDPGIDLIMVDSGLDANDNEAIVALDSTSTAAAPAFTVLWQDTSDYFTSDLRGSATDRDGYCYVVPTTIQTASLSGTVRPYINRIRADGILQRIFLNTDITQDGASPFCDDSITVNPANGSVWLATAASTSEGLIYPRTLWRIDAINAAPQGGNDFLATTTAEITSVWYNIGINALAWSPDGKYLAIGCVDTDQLYIYTATVPTDCAAAIQEGYTLANDFNHDCRVNLLDFTQIDFDDLALFVESWLNCMDPQTCDWLWP